MALFLTDGLLSAVLFFCVLCASEDPQEIRVKPGHDATLQCLSPPGASIILLEWKRPDLKSDYYVFLYRNKRSYEKYQHPRFRGRVELRDPEMMSGDVSVVLKNVSVNDTGTYECQVLINITGRSETNTEIKKLVLLKVTDSGHTTGNKDVNLVLAVGLSVGVLLLVIILGICFLIVKPLKKNSYKSPAENAGVSMT